MNTKSSDWMWLAAGLLALPFAISPQSIWIDEAQTWVYVSMQDPSQLLDHFIQDGKSEALMPLSMLLAWIWGQILGTSELALRLPNLLYLGFGAYAIWRIGVQNSMPWLVLLFSFNPFVWQYADEARPYALQIGLGAVVVAAFWRLVQKPADVFVPFLIFLLGCFLLSATSLLAVVPVGFLCAALLVVFLADRPSLSRGIYLSFGIFCVAMLALGLFYLWALQKGSTSAKLWEVGLGNLAFAIYELFGFGGLGPGRNDLREAALHGQLRDTVMPFLIGLCAAGAIMVSVAALGRMPEGKSPRWAWFGTGFAVCLSFMALFILAKFAGFPFWGRHFAPVLPMLIVVLGIWIGNPRPPAAGRLLVGLVVLFYATSALQLRHHPRFAKDDYHTAAVLAAEALAAKQTVWWAADGATGAYYGLDLGERGAQHDVVLLMGPQPEELLALPAPDLIILSKPDIYDHKGALANFLKTNDYKLREVLPAFHIYDNGKN